MAGFTPRCSTAWATSASLENNAGWARSAPRRGEGLAPPSGQTRSCALIFGGPRPRWSTSVRGELREARRTWRSAEFDRPRGRGTASMGRRGRSSRIGPRQRALPSATRSRPRACCSTSSSTSSRTRASPTSSSADSSSACASRQHRGRGRPRGRAPGAAASHRGAPRAATPGGERAPREGAGGPGRRPHRNGERARGAKRPAWSFLGPLPVFRGAFGNDLENPDTGRARLELFRGVTGAIAGRWKARFARREAAGRHAPGVQAARACSRRRSG